MKIILKSLAVLVFLISCASEPEEPIVTEVVSVPEPEPEPEPEPKPVLVEPAEPVFEVSDEIYQTTFDETEKLIKELNAIISKRNYDLWKKYLSQTYILTYNNKENLKAFAEVPLLKENGIELNNLRDYFNWVVVPSRSNAKVDDIVFDNETHITAYTTFKDQKGKLYQLEKIDGTWKISTW